MKRTKQRTTKQDFFHRHYSHMLQQPRVIITPPQDTLSQLPQLQYQYQQYHHLLPHGDKEPQLLTQQPRPLAHREQQEGLPPPPPSSPMVETHSLELDSSNKVKYTMHINLGKLQHNIEQSERSTGMVPYGVLMGGKNERIEKGVQLSKSSKKTGTQVVRTLDSRTREQHVIRTPSRGQEGGGEDDEEMEEEEGEEVKQDGKLDVAGTDEKMQLTGLTIAVLRHEAMPNLADTKAENVAMIKQAKKEINKTVLRLRQPATKSLKLAPKQDAMSKDDFVFTRVYGTMHLSLLRKVEGVHHTRKRSEEHKQMVQRVAQARRERLLRRGMIEAFQNHLRERVHMWRCEEEGRLDQKKEALEKRRQANLLEQCRLQESATLTSRRRRDDREFSSHFRQNNTLISNTLSAEDRRASLGGCSAGTTEKVRQVREESLEQQQEAYRYLELRRSRLVQEGRQSKKEINAKTLEVCLCVHARDTVMQISVVHYGVH